MIMAELNCLQSVKLRQRTPSSKAQQSPQIGYPTTSPGGSSRPQEVEVVEEEHHVKAQYLSS